MKRTTAGLVTILALALVALAGCGKGQNGSPSPTAATTAPSAEMADFEVTSPDEARSEAERTIDQDNADEVFDQLQQEIEAELDGGGG